jgi:hypothetical protein
MSFARPFKLLACGSARAGSLVMNFAEDGTVVVADASARQP